MDQLRYCGQLLEPHMVEIHNVVRVRLSTVNAGVRLFLLNNDTDQFQPAGLRCPDEASVFLAVLGIPDFSLIPSSISPVRLGVFVWHAAS